MSIIKTTIPVSSLKQGDTVEINGNEETVIPSYLKYCSFMGWTYKGSPFPSGITKINYKVPIKGGFRYE